MKKLCFILCIICALLCSACSSKTYIPGEKKLISYMKKAGYTVEKHSSIGDIDVILRIVATKGDSVLDVCYKVKDGDIDAII